MSRLVKKYEQNLLKQKILEDVSRGLTYQSIREKHNVTIRYIDETLKSELAKTDTPEKILELREASSRQIQTHTPRLATRFVRYSDIEQQLLEQYGRLLDTTQNQTYQTFYQTYISQGLDQQEAHTQATLDYQQILLEREQLTKEIDKIAKQTDNSYKTYLAQQKRLAELHGLDTPTQHQLLISRNDTIKVELDEDIRKAQKAKQQNNMPAIETTTIEAQIVEEE